MAKFNFNPAKNEAGDFIPNAIQAQFDAKVIAFNSDADGIKTYKSNSTGAAYHIATIEFENSNGDIERQAARVYAGNYMSKEGELRMKVGETYNATVLIQEGFNPFITVSHLQGAGFSATESTFGVTAATKAAVAASIEETLHVEESRD